MQSVTENTPSNDGTGWEGWRNAVEVGRFEMVGPFQEWVVSKRHEVHRALVEKERYLSENAPLIGHSITSASGPKTVPLHVIEFAEVAAEVIELRQDLGLLDLFYSDFAGRVSERLTFADGTPRDLHTLYNWFLHETVNSKEVEA